MDKSKKPNYKTILNRYGALGVKALEAHTPSDTGVTRKSWRYKITHEPGRYSITWTNSNLAPGGIPIVILLQYGHASRNGTYVPGRDFINPALRPILDNLSNDLWREVTNR